MTYTWEQIQSNRKAFVDRMRELHKEGIEPGQGELSSEDGDCATGVACHVFVKDTGRGEERMIDHDEVDDDDWAFYGFEIDGEVYTKYPPESVSDWLGVSFAFMGEIMNMNDFEYYTFDKVAEWAEENFDAYSIVTPVQMYAR